MRKHEIALITVLQAAWALLLSRCQGRSSLVIGTEVSGRPASLARSDAIVGRLSGVVPRRIAVPDSGSVSSWLRAIASDNRAAEPHAHASLTQIREWLGRPVDEPLFHSAVAAEVIAEDDRLAELGRRLGFRELALAAADPPWPLTLSAQLRSQLAVTLRYDPRRLPSRVVTGITGALATLIANIVEQPDRDLASMKLDRLDWLDRRERPTTAEPSPSRAGFAADDFETILAQHPLVRAVRVEPSERHSGFTARVEPREEALAPPPKQLDFSMFYFSDADSEANADKYRIYLEGAKFADRNDFVAVWTPERHFHQNGGLYPNPSLLSAALATITERVELRAGSVVVPLHHPLRVAEEWSVVDNLSGGRAAIAVASGWVPNDFAFAPGIYEKRRAIMFEKIEQVQRLWRGESMEVIDGLGREAQVRAFPRPIQPELPIWFTAAGNPDTYEKAGELGCNILTALLYQSLEEVAEKVQLYRAARQRCGHDPAAGKVTLMLHTYLGDDLAEVIDIVRGPFTKYLRSHVSLMESMVKSMNMETGAIDINDPTMLGTIWPRLPTSAIFAPAP